MGQRERMIVLKTILSFILISLTISVSGKTIYVGGNSEIKSIAEGVRIAAPGDTIIIRKGGYRPGNIIIEKSLTIIGEGMPVLNGENKFEIFTIHAHHVTIKGLKFVDTGVSSINDIAGIKVLDSKFVKILNNEFHNNFFAIHVSNSSDLRVENNLLTAEEIPQHQVGNGIHLWKCDHVTIRNNKVSNHRDGIYFEFVTNSLIEHNESFKNIRYGLHFMFSHNNEYRSNLFKENGAGVAVMYTTGVKMIDNIFEKNWGASAYGLLLKDIRDSEVRGNIFEANSVGIHMEGSSRIQFTSNAFHQNGYAIRLQASCDGNTFSGNNFSANTFDIATNGSLVLNQLESNYWDKYEGYDLDKNNIGDVPYHPVSMYSMVVEQMPTAVLLWRSFLVFLLDRAEKAIPAMTPENLKDATPLMKPYDLSNKREQVVWKTARAR